MTSNISEQTSATFFLDSIQSPADLKKIYAGDLPALAEEIRREIIRVVTKNGGHLASSLGVVELIIAMHYVFDLPEDQLVFDVGHQTYAHKILTGRRAGFENIRREGGLSGFPKRAESPYDQFDTGHSSTSVSAALGLACARDLKGLNHHVAAVLGDGALTGGMALEALNHAGDLQKRLLVVLNDNCMSISPNVGGLAAYFSLKFTRREHVQLREKVKDALRQIMPTRSKRLIAGVQKVEEAMKSFFNEPSTFFEALGFRYVGPFDGHDLPSLIDAFTNVKNLNRPVLLHIITTKGKGYPPAENDPCSFHGVGGNSHKQEAYSEDGLAPAGPGIIEVGENYCDIFGRHLETLAEADERIVAISAAMSQGTGLAGFFKKFPERSFDVGIAEQHAVTLAAGLAAAGLRPVVAIYSSFLQRAFDQLFHDVALQNLPVLLAVDRAGLVGEDGPTHHGGLDLSYLRLLPNFTVMAPADGGELKAMMDFGLSLEGPSSIRYPRGASPNLKIDFNSLDLGRGSYLKKGDDLTILTLGQTISPALEAADKLAENGRSAAVINLRFIKPLDEDLILAEALKTGRILTVEENVLSGGLGGAVAELLARKSPRQVHFENLGLNVDHPAAQASQNSQRKTAGLDSDSIYKTALALLAKP